VHPIPGRYETDGQWFKGNTHIHTTRSDGGKDYATVASLYAGRGYDFVFVTDHDVVADIEGMPGLPLLALNGIEVGGQDGTGAHYHVVGLGCSDALPSEGTFEKRIAALRRSGAVLILAHPYWTGNTVADALRHRFDGVEVYNHICDYLNGKSLSAYHWDRMLARDPRALGFAADDAHLNGNEPWDGAWIMLSAPALTRADVMAAIQSGSFYSTVGPTFESIRVEADRVRVRTSPVAAIRLVDGTCWGARVYPGVGQTVTEGEFQVQREHAYLRVEIEDAYGRRAWTNAVLEGSA